MNRTGLVVLLSAAACARPGAEIDPRQLEAFAPLDSAMVSSDNPITPAKVALGRMLYHDARLSVDRSVSCNSCHPLDRYGVDQEAVSEGVRGQLGGRNAPTVYHAAGQIAQFWDGRAPTVEEQAKGPILNPVEMAMPSADAVVARLAAIPGYRVAFRDAFPGEADPITYDNVGRAIGAFERLLVTPSRWDAYLDGDRQALTAEEKAGFRQFTAVGCQTCHYGTYVGGAAFQRLGVAQPWPDRSDLGRVTVTQAPSDTLVFKVPTLRNVQHTGPYFNDGRVAALDEAVRLMGRYQLGRDLSDAEVGAIVTWLHALTGPLPAEYVAAPAVPAEGGP